MYFTLLDSIRVRLHETVRSNCHRLRLKQWQTQWNKAYWLHSTLESHVARGQTRLRLSYHVTITVECMLWLFMIADYGYANITQVANHSKLGQDKLLALFSRLYNIRLTKLWQRHNFITLDLVDHIFPVLNHPLDRREQSEWHCDCLIAHSVWS